MEITRSLKVHNNLNTELYNFLANLPDEVLYNTEHNLRKPLGIYNISSTRVFKAFNNVLDILESKAFKYIELTDHYRELLMSIMSFIDDSYHLMKCLFPVSSVDKHCIFADKWMEKVEPQIIKQYKSDINDYRDLIAKIVNKTKHNHALFSNIKISTNIGTIYGYCIMGVDGTETVLPDEEIHKPVGKMSTGFSYNRDIRYHIINFYFVSNLIVKAMRSLLNKIYGQVININSAECSNNEEIWNLFTRINGMRHLYFPDEYNKLMPQIELNQDEKSIRLRYPSTKSYLNKLFRYNGYKVEYITSGDGVTKSFKMPYMGEER